MTDLLDHLRTAVGADHVLTDVGDVAAYVVDWTGVHEGRALAVVRPGSTDEVSAVVGACHEAGVAIVPQGGNTGLVGGGVPDASGEQVVLSLGRMRTVREVDPVAGTITVDAGVVLADVQAAAGSGRSALPDVAGLRGQLHDRRQPRHERRWHRSPALRDDPRARARSRGRAARRPGLGRTARPAQGQHRLRPDPALRRLRRHARRDHRCDPATVPGHPAARDSLGRGAVGRGGGLAARRRTAARGRAPVHVRDRQPAGARPRARAPARRERPAGRAERLVRPGRARRRRQRPRPGRRPRGDPRGRGRGGPRERCRDRRQPGAALVALGPARGHLGGAEGRGGDPQARRHAAHRAPRRVGCRDGSEPRRDPARACGR